MKNFLCFVVIVVSINSILELFKNDTVKPSQKNQQIKLTFDQKVNNCFSGFDNSHIKLKRFIKNNLKNPDSFKFVENTTSWTKKQENNGVFEVYMKFRGTNSFGAIVVNEIIVLSSVENCEIIKIISH